MCQIPLSPSMASSSKNPKRLNPNASPFQKLDSKPLQSSPPQLPSTGRHFFTHENLSTPQPSQLTQILPVAQPLPVAPPPLPGVICYPPIHLYHHQPTPPWACPAVVATTVYYNAHKQPLPATNTVPYYFDSATKESSLYLLNTEPVELGNSEYRNNPSYVYDQKSFVATAEDKVTYLNVKALGCQEGSHRNRAVKGNIAKRFRSKKKETMRYSCKTGDGVLDPQYDNVNAFSLNLEGKTSLMIRNIPNQFERIDLIDILDAHCREENIKAKLRSDPIKSAYDFLYLPMDFCKRANLGYAFVNFTNPAGALRFATSFHKREWHVEINKKTCEICCAKVQGKHDLTNHFKNSIFECHTKAYLPVVFWAPRDGLLKPRPVLVGRHVAAAVAVNRRKHNLTK